MESGDIRKRVNPQASTMSPAEMMNIVKRHKFSLMIPFCCVVALAVGLALLLPPKYRSTATILIEEQEIPSDFVMATVTSFAEQRLQQINQRIMSTTKLMEIIDRFDLYKKMREKRTTEEVINQMRKDVRMRPISADVVDQRTGRPTTATIAFSLAYQGKDSPGTIQEVASVLVSLFLKENLHVRERQTSETYQFLEEEMNRVKKELNTIEITISEFKEKHINSLPELLQVNIQGLSHSERSIERLDEQLRSIKEREGYLQTQLANLSPFLDSSDRNRLHALGTELVALQVHFSADHPDVIKTISEINALEKKLASDSSLRDIDPNEPDNPAYITLASQLASTRTDIRSVKNQIQEFQKTRSAYQNRIERTPGVERRYKELSSRQMNIQAKFNDLMQKQMEAKVAHGLEKGQKGERFTLIDPPRLPEKPFKPNRQVIILFGVGLGLFAGAGWTFLRDYVDPSVRSGDRLSLDTGFPVLGQIPNILTQKDRQSISRRRLASLSTAVFVAVVGLAGFHFFIMDLSLVWLKLGRKIMIP